MHRHALALLALAAALAAGCSEPRTSTGEDGGDGEGGSGGGAGGSGGGAGGSGGFFGSTSIYDLQDPGRGAVSGSEVVVRGVVVTAVQEVRQPDDSFAPQHFYVMEPEGGPYSGIFVRNGGNNGPVTAAPAQGDVVTITGTFTEFFDRSQIELLSIEVTGTAAVPTPVDVDAESIATGGLEQELYEGVLVRVADAVVTETPVLGNDGADHGAFRINAAGRATGGVVVEDDFGHDYVRVLGDRFQSVVGVMDYSFEQAALLPRSNDDLTFLDGTHPGLTEAGEVTIFQIQDVAAEGHPRPPSSVIVRDVVVTAAAGSRFWAQEQAGGPFSGIQVRLADGATAPRLGDVVTVAATYTEYFDVSQLQDATVEVTAAAPALPLPAVVEAAEVRTGAATAEPWEGVLVEVRDVSNVEDPVLGSDQLDRGDFRVAATAGGTIETGVVVGHVFANDYEGTVGDAFSSIVGVLDFSFGEFRLEPRGNEDITFTDGTHPTVPEVGVVTVYQLQDEGHPDFAGTNIRATVENVVVTAANDRDFWVQEAGAPEFAGLAVRPGALAAVTIPAVGSVVNVHGQVYEYFGKTQLTADLVEVVSPAGTIPTPVVVAAADVATGGADAETYEGVLVEVRGVENVEDPVLGTDGQDRGDFRVNEAGLPSGLVVGHAFFDDYDGQVGDGFSSLVGVLDWSFDESRLETRGNEDITFTDGTHPEPPVAGVVTIQELQDVSLPTHPAEGAGVEVQGVVVTAVRGLDLWVMDPAGGPFSGIALRLPGDGSIAAPVVGTLVDVGGTYDEFFDRSQLQVSALTDRGPGTVPAAEVLTPDELATGAATAERWEGVLVEVRSVENTQDPVPGSDGVDRGDFRVQAFGGTGGVIVGHAMPTDYAGSVGDRFQSIVGVLDFSFEEFRLEPRGNDDVTFEDGTHPSPNVATTTVYAIQDGTMAEGANVRVEGVVVTAVRANGSFFVMDPAGGPYSGVYVFKPAAVVLPAIAVGDVVDLEGATSEYFDLTELEVTAATVTGTAPVPAPAVLSPDDIRTGSATAEQWEGVLVTVLDVQVTEANVLENGADRGAFRVAPTPGDGTPGDDLLVDDLFPYAYTANRTLDDVFASVTGLVDYSFSNYRLQPRGDSDLVP